MRVVVRTVWEAPSWATERKGKGKSWTAEMENAGRMHGQPEQEGYREQAWMWKKLALQLSVWVLLIFSPFVHFHVLCQVVFLLESFLSMWSFLGGLSKCSVLRTHFISKHEPLAWSAQFPLVMLARPSRWVLACPSSYARRPPPKESLPCLCLSSVGEQLACASQADPFYERAPTCRRACWT